MGSPFTLIMIFLVFWSNVILFNLYGVVFSLVSVTCDVHVPFCGMLWFFLWSLWYPMCAYLFDSMAWYFFGSLRSALWRVSAFTDFVVVSTLVSFCLLFMTLGIAILKYLRRLNRLNE